MTGSGVEREPRAAYLSSSGVPVGVSPSMPPHSQGAERRRGRRAGRTASRWGLRALIVGGLAGTAWLLAGAAAHAAEHAPNTEPALLGSVLSNVVQDGVQAGQNGEDQGRGLISVTALPGKLVEALDPATHDGVIRGLTAPLRLAGEAVDTRNLAPVTDPLPDRAASPPAAQRVTASTATAVDAGEPGQARPARVVVADETAADPVGSGTGDEELPAAERELDRRIVVGKTVARQHAIAAGRHPAAARAAPSGTVRDTPGGDGPAPLRVHLGAANGVPALGSGAGTDGGPAAVVPARVADSTVACHRLPIATDVEVRRYDAGAPTVSPD